MSPEVKQRLRAHITDTGKFPEAIIHDVLGDVMELLGFEREHGQQCCKECFTAKEFQHDEELIRAHSKWEQVIDSECLTLLNQYRKDGGVLNLNDVTAAKLREVRAKEELDAMSPEERGQLLDKNVKKVDIFRKLPPDARKRHLEKLSDEEKLELTKSEILMITIMQHQAQQSVEDRVRQSQNVD